MKYNSQFPGDGCMGRYKIVGVPLTETHAIDKRTVARDRSPPSPPPSPVAVPVSLYIFLIGEESDGGHRI